MEKVLLLLIIIIIFAGCATESDPDRINWEDAKKQLASAFEEHNAAMAQAEMQGLSEDQNQASSNPFKY
jgi:PBP1b-binding outer membrane lipoprotein LpoB